MFIKSGRTWYTRDGQRASGSFLLLVSRKTDMGAKEIRCFVRHVKLHQMGHWMMGYMHIGQRCVHLSGSYGADGLTKDVDDALFDAGVPLPPELREAWAHGDGWNSAGSEGPSIQAWALQNLNALRRAGRDLAAAEGT